MKYVFWLGRARDEDSFHPKCLLLNNISKFVRVPETFVVSRKAFERFLMFNKIENKEEISAGQFPKDLKDELLNAYTELSFSSRLMTPEILKLVAAGRDYALVSLRAYSGKFSCVEYCVKGIPKFLEKIKEVWEKVYDGSDYPTILIQKMIFPEKSWVVRTESLERGFVEIRATWGFPDLLPRVESDVYRVKLDGSILEVKIGEKRRALIRDLGTDHVIEVPVSPQKSKARVLSDEEIRRCLDILKDLEGLGKLMLTFGKERNKIYLLDVEYIKSMRFVKFLRELTKKDLSIAGGKGANLGEMFNAGLPVPDAFVVTTEAYRDFLERTGIKTKIFDILEKTDITNPKELEENTKKIRELIISTKMPQDIKDEIEEAYKQLSREFGKKEEYVAIRSSATAEDIEGASFAGQQLTLLNVKGAENVVEGVKRCWASLFTARATFYRAEKGFEHEKVLIAVPVQKQLGALPKEDYLSGKYKAGVGFTIHPTTGDKSKIVIEGSWGQGESVVSGAVTPDTYVIDKETGKVVERNIVEKKIMRITNLEKGGLEEIEVPEEMKNVPCLTEEELKQLWELAKRLEEHYGFPQDFEWVSEKGKVYLVQSRPVTVFYEKKEEEMKEVGKVLVKGLGASPGMSSGKVKIIFGPEEIDKVKEGDVLVTKMTNPDLVPAMKRASAIVTDEGGLTSHAAIVSRELGIPCVVGTGNATKVLKDEQVVTVDGSKGLVYEGVVKAKKVEEISIEEVAKLKTRTKIYMNLGVPEKIEDYKHLPFDGIGLMRVEFIIASYVKKHPNYLLEIGKGEEYVNKLAEGIAKVAKAIFPRPVVVRFSDFKTNEYRQLEGGEKFEPEEDNPMIGWRGVSRYISPEFERAFRLECKAIKKVRDEGLTNVWVMLPFVRTTWEVEKCLKIMEEEGLKKSEDFKVWLMAEVPSIIFLADEFSKLCDGFSIGSNDLTQLVLGVDRDSGILGRMGYFDERNKAVLRAIAHLIKVAHQHSVTVSICGQAASVYPEFTRFLIKAGIDSVSVNPDAVVKTKKLVYEAEKEIELEKEINFSF